MTEYGLKYNFLASIYPRFILCHSENTPYKSHRRKLQYSIRF